MKYPLPCFSRSQVKKAGRILCGKTEGDLHWAYEVLSNWRSCHGYPLNTFQATLRDKLKQIDPNALVAQRLKRTPSIVRKLIREPVTKLSTMQDIGGLRAVVKDVPAVERLVDEYRKSRFQHKLLKVRDYISSPKSSGYRSVHLIYRYKNVKRPEYDGLHVELQVRTRMQHNWATAVETAEVFLKKPLKASEGPQPWLDFFTVCGAAFAGLENRPLVPGYEGHTKKEIYRLCADAADELKVDKVLSGFAAVVDNVEPHRKAEAFHLVVLDTDKEQVTIKPFSEANLQKANDEYAALEREVRGDEARQVVLVSAGPIGNLKKAYPNYFLDAHDFLSRLDRVKGLARK